MCGKGGQTHICKGHGSGQIAQPPERPEIWYLGKPAGKKMTHQASLPKAYHNWMWRTRRCSFLDLFWGMSTTESECASRSVEVAYNFSDQTHALDKASKCTAQIPPLHFLSAGSLKKGTYTIWMPPNMSIHGRLLKLHGAFGSCSNTDL